MKPIGPTFAAELAAHGGLLGEHFTWSPTGVLEFFDDTPAAVTEGVQAVYAAHDPSAVLVVVPDEITRRQMLLAMVGDGLITGDEALAAAAVGAVPAAIDAVFAQLPAEQALFARVTWATMAVAARSHELITLLIDAELATPERVDGIFIAGAAIP